MSFNCYNYQHSSKTMERVNYRIVEEDSGDFESLTTDTKNNHFWPGFYSCFPMCHSGPSYYVSGSPRRRYRIALYSAYRGENVLFLQGIVVKWKAVVRASLKSSQ